jgi:hypothetical protein
MSSSPEIIDTLLSRRVHEDELDPDRSFFFDYYFGDCQFAKIKPRIESDGASRGSVPLTRKSEKDKSEELHSTLK